MAVAAREVQVAKGDKHAVAIERKLVVDPKTGRAARVENVSVAVRLEDGTVGVARRQRIHFVQRGGRAALKRISSLGQIKEANNCKLEDTSNNEVTSNNDATSNKEATLSIKQFETLYGSGACLLILLIFALLPVVAVIIGSVYLTRCEFINDRSNTNVPIWLIVFGGIGVLQTLVHICKQCCQRICKSSAAAAEDNDKGNSMSTLISRCVFCCDSFFIAFQFVWMIVGSVWVFGVFRDYQKTGDSCVDCCHTVPYLFSFIFLILVYIFGALGVCCSLCCVLCIQLGESDSDSSS